MKNKLSRSNSSLQDEADEYQMLNLQEKQDFLNQKRDFQLQLEELDNKINKKETT